MSRTDPNQIRRVERLLRGLNTLQRGSVRIVGGELQVNLRSLSGLFVDADDGLGVMAGEALQADRDGLHHRWDVIPGIAAEYDANQGELVECDPTGGAFTVNLPPLGRVAIGAGLIVKNASASTNTITVDAHSTETIDGATTQTITTARGQIHLVRGSEEWLVV